MKSNLAITVLVSLMIVICTSCNSKKASPEEQEYARKMELVQPIVDKVNNSKFYGVHYDGEFRGMARTNEARIHRIDYIPEENCIYIYLGDNQMYWGISNGHITDDSEISEWIRYDLGLFRYDIKDLLNTINTEKIGLICYVTSIGSPDNCSYTMALNDYMTPTDFNDEADEFMPDDWEGNSR